jgi:hypothetical protein
LKKEKQNKTNTVSATHQKKIKHNPSKLHQENRRRRKRKEKKKNSPQKRLFNSACSVPTSAEV